MKRTFTLVTAIVSLVCIAATIAVLLGFFFYFIPEYTAYLAEQGENAAGSAAGVFGGALASVILLILTCFLSAVGGAANLAASIVLLCSLHGKPSPRRAQIASLGLLAVSPLLLAALIILYSVWSALSFPWLPLLGILVVCADVVLRIVLGATVLRAIRRKAREDAAPAPSDQA